MNRIESLLKDRGIAKIALAERLGTSKQNVNSLLKNPRQSTLAKIAAALDVPVWQLFVSPEDVCSADADFFAVVKSGRHVDIADSLDELTAIIDKLKSDGQS